MMHSPQPRDRAPAELRQRPVPFDAPVARQRNEPPPLPRRASRKMAGHSERTPGEARTYVTAVLGQWGVSRDIMETLRLIVSELTTNSVRHTCSPQITVTVTRTDREAAVSVADHGPSCRLGPRSAPLDADHGRGLAIVAALASRWEQHQRGGGTTVRAGIDLPPPNAPAQQSAEGTTDTLRFHRQ